MRFIREPNRVYKGTVICTILKKEMLTIFKMKQRVFDIDFAVHKSFKYVISWFLTI